MRDFVSTDDGSGLLTETLFKATRLRGPSRTIANGKQAGDFFDSDHQATTNLKSSRNGCATNGFVTSNGHRGATGSCCSNGNGHAATAGMDSNADSARHRATAAGDKRQSSPPSESSGPNQDTDEAGRALCKINDVPGYLRFNPFILTGYRAPELTSSQCIASLCYFHNETVNIMTHAVALVFFLFYMPKHIPWDKIDLPIFAYCHVVGSFSSWVGSSIYHLFMNHQRGEGFYFNLLRWDVAGIWVTQTFGACSTLWTSVYHYPLWLQVAFISIYVLLSLRALRDSLLANSVWKRIMGFAYLFFMRVVAFSLRVNAVESGAASPLIHILMQEIWPLLGSCISATRVPERWFPGRFDLYLNSHNLMHIFVVLGAFHMHWATCTDLVYLADLSKQAPVIDETVALF